MDYIELKFYRNIQYSQFMIGRNVKKKYRTSQDRMNMVFNYDFEGVIYGGSLFHYDGTTSITLLVLTRN